MNSTAKIGKNEISQEKEQDSDENSVHINEKDEVESYVKKYISGITPVVKSKHKSQAKALNKSLTNIDSKIIKETPEEYDNNVTVEGQKISNNNAKVIQEDMLKTNIKLKSTNTGYSTNENVSNSAKPKLGKITTKIELEIENKDSKENLNITESAETTNVGNTINLVNDNKSTVSKKKLFKEKFPTSKLNLSDKDKEKKDKIESNFKRRQSSDLAVIPSLVGPNTKSNTQNILINNSSNNSNNLKKDSQSLQIFYDKFSSLKKDVFKRFALSEKRVGEIESSYKLAFDQLLNQIKNFVPINFALNQIITKTKGFKSDMNENYTINNASQYSNNNPYKENQNIVNHNTVSVNILDPTIIFKNSEFDSNNKVHQKKNVANLVTLKNNLRRM